MSFMKFIQTKKAKLIKIDKFLKKFAQKTQITSNLLSYNSTNVFAILNHFKATFKLACDIFL